MDAGTLSVQKIFGYDRRLIVPLFQRPYVWTRDMQWEPLWNDIRAVADRLARGSDSRPHFLGAIVLDMIPKPTGHLETRLVIDGQQRLTTIQLLLEAFSDICADRGIDRYDRALLKLTRNDDPMSEDYDDQFKVWPTNVDQDHFRKVMMFRTPQELLKDYGKSAGAKTAGQAIADAYLFFHGVIEEWLEPDAEGFENRVEALYDTLRGHVRLVVIDLEKEDDAQLIFETLNARGTPLLPADLIKNFLFHRAQIEGRAIEPLYRQYWCAFDEEGEYWRRELGRGHARRARIDTFFQHYLTLSTEDEISVSQLYNGFRDYVHESIETLQAEDHLDSLRRYADVYQGFEKFDLHSCEQVFFERLGLMEYITIYPFILELFFQYREEPGEIRTVLQDLESFLVRRLVCQLNTRGYGRLFIDMLPTLRAEGRTPSVHVRDFLLTSSAEGRRWPDDKEFRDAWMGTPVYRSLVRKRVRMLLEALERQVQSPMTEKLIIGEKLTVEHLLPQQWETHWPLPPDRDPLEARMRREQLLHTVGNLTLLTKKLNPSISNGKWERKKKSVKKHSALALNREVCEVDVWDEKAIITRGKGLFKHAQKLWPYPKQEQPRGG